MDRKEQAARLNEIKDALRTQEHELSKLPKSKHIEKFMHDLVQLRMDVEYRAELWEEVPE